MCLQLPHVYNYTHLTLNLYKTTDKLTSLFWDSWSDDKEETEVGELFKREFNKGEDAGVGLGEWDAEDLGDVSWDFAKSDAISISVLLLSEASAFIKKTNLYFKKL